MKKQKDFLFGAPVRSPDYLVLGRLADLKGEPGETYTGHSGLGNLDKLQQVYGHGDLDREDYQIPANSPYHYRMAPNQTEFSVYTGLGTTPLDLATLAKDVPCQNACPAKTDVPAYIQALSQGDPDKAYRINLEDNVFPSVLGRVCTRPCESACRHNWTNTNGPVRICHLKRAGADHHTFVPEPFSPWFGPSGKRIAVIGGGPAGLTAARQLLRYGHQVEIFEREDHLGGMMLDGIPRFRLPADQVRAEIDLIVRQGAKVHLGHNVDATALAALVKDFDSVLLAAGTMKAKKLALQGLETLANPGPAGLATPEPAPANTPASPTSPVWDGLAFMKAFNDGDLTSLSGDVVVIGGGFTAVDCARSCARAARTLAGSGAQVTIAYRRAESHMAADSDELEEIRSENIGIRTLLAPVGIETENGRLKAVRFQRSVLSSTQKDKNGKPAIIPVEDGFVSLRCSHLIIAIGQDANYSILGKEIKLGWKEGSSGLLDSGLQGNPGQRTNHPKVFAAGDFLTGSSDVIHAVAEGKAAADEIDRFLTGAMRVKHHVSVELIINETQTGRTRDHDLISPPAMPVLDKAARLDPAAEVELGLLGEEVLANASRCYLCNHKLEIDQDKCIHCEWCIEVTPRNCIKKVNRIFRTPDGVPKDLVEANTASDATFIYIDSDECIRCGKCIRVCPVKAINFRKMERTPCTPAATPNRFAALRSLPLAPQKLGGFAALGHQATENLPLPEATGGPGPAPDGSGVPIEWVAIKVKRP